MPVSVTPQSASSPPEDIATMSETTTEILIARIAVTGQLADDGAIELVSLDLDTIGGWD